MKDATIRKQYACLAVAGAIMVGLGLVGCGPRETQTTVVTTEPATPAVVTTTEPATVVTGTTTVTAKTRRTPAKTDNTNAGVGGATGTEIEIADTISKKIIRNRQMTGARVTPVVDPAGMVTLNGIVQNQQQKALAEKAARDTSGVTAVENKLEIRPTLGARKPRPATPAPTQTTRIVVVAPTPAKSAPAANSASPKRRAKSPAPKAPKTPPAPPAEETTEPAEPEEAPEAPEPAETETEPAEPTEPVEPVEPPAPPQEEEVP